ncbi:MAG: hypothetical protein NVSMB32_16560 [Actinomycetota bacterium]
MLASLHRFKTWPAGRALEARCPYAEAETHAGPSPGVDCGCGLYAALDLETLRELANPDLVVPRGVGEVALWGRVIPADLGYRAQFAYPRRLWVVRESVPALEWMGALPMALARNYGVPVDLCDASWAMPDGALSPWPVAGRFPEERSAIVAFKEGVDLLAAALQQGPDVYRAALGRLTGQEREATLARQGFQRSLTQRWPASDLRTS